MKTMTCLQLGGACGEKFTAESFEEIAEMSKNHGMQKYQEGDQPHLEAMTEMQRLMQTPDAMEKWFEDKRNEFNALPNQ